jgi:YD repeat-containing protein
LRNLKSDQSIISIFTYTYDAVGNRLGVSEANGDLVTWSYDETYQLTREQRTGANVYDITYTYDGVGNRLTKLAGGVITSSSYDAANQLLTANCRK